MYLCQDVRLLYDGCPMNKTTARKNIKPIVNFSLVDHIERSLRNYFTEENLQLGDPIPKETELAEAMGVSRTAIREALARLKMLGIIESRRNRGMILTQPDVLGSFKQVLDPMLLDSDTLKDIFELRLVLEIGIADFLFLRKSKQNLEELDSIVQREENTNDPLSKAKIDAEFHAKLYDISGNHTIQRFQRMLMPIFNYVHNGTIAGKSNPKKPITHRDLLECLKFENPDTFRMKMKTHLDVYFENAI